MPSKRSRCVVWLLALASANIVGQSAPPYEQAMALFQQRKFAAAADAFSKIERQCPGKTDALLYAAKAMVNQKEWPGAEFALKEYVATHPRSEDALYLLSYVYFREDRPTESLDAATRAAKIRNPGADDLKIVALDYGLLGDYTDSARYLEQAVALDPHNKEALYHLGRVRYIQNKFDDAVAAFRRVLAIDPENVKAADNLGLSLEGKGDTAGAIAAYRNAIRLQHATLSKESYERPYLNLGRVLLGQGHASEARQALMQATQIAPKSAEAHLQLGKAELDMESLDLARQDLELAVALDEENIAAHYTLARLYHRTGQREREARELRRTEELNQKHR